MKQFLMGIILPDTKLLLLLKYKYKNNTLMANHMIIQLLCQK